MLGGFQKGSNKVCIYVYKYFFVFPEYTVPEYSLPKHCKFTANHKLFDFYLIQIFPENPGCWMRGGCLSPVHPWIHSLSQAGAPVPHLLLGHFLLPEGQGDFPSERLQLPLSLLERPSILGIHNTKVFLVCSILFLAQPFFGLKGMGDSTISQSESSFWGKGAPGWGITSTSGSRGTGGASCISRLGSFWMVMESGVALDTSPGGLLAALLSLGLLLVSLSGDAGGSANTK